MALFAKKGSTDLQLSSIETFGKLCKTLPMAEPLQKKPARPRNTEVEALVEASGRTQAEVAAYLTRRLGRDFVHYHVSRMISGARTVAHDEMDALRELADRPLAPTPTAAPVTVDTGDVPLFGYANAAGSTLRLNDDAILGVVPLHPAQRGSRGAFAFICFGDSVSPRLQHGDVGYAIRNRPPLKKQLAVIEKRDGEVLVKFYEGQDERTLHLSESQPKLRQISIPLREVVAVHAVVGSTFGAG